MRYNFPLHEAFILAGTILIFLPVADGTGIAPGIPSGPVPVILLPVGTAAVFIFSGTCDLFREVCMAPRSSCNGQRGCGAVRPS